jgi:hypothetical protein
MRQEQGTAGRALAPIRDGVVIARKFFIGGRLACDHLGREIREALDAKRLYFHLFRCSCAQGSL